ACSGRRRGGAAADAGARVTSLPARRGSRLAGAAPRPAGILLGDVSGVERAGGVQDRAQRCAALRGCPSAVRRDGGVVQAASPRGRQRSARGARRAAGGGGGHVQ
ncbi:unnamed protein product, partial [Prorocentrum cordatum]